MPELPDITIYIEALERRIGGATLERVRLASSFLLRSVDPPLKAFEGQRVTGLRRLGKRIVFELEDELFLVLHLMIAGRLHWHEHGKKIAGKIGLAAFDFSPGTLTLTEAGTKKRASLYAVRGEAGLAAHDPGGLEIFAPGTNVRNFTAALTSQNRTLKRALTDPRLFAGIGNAYSDEILHRARLSLFERTRDLDGAEVARLYQAVRDVMREWIARLRAEAGDGFPEKVTAFRPEMAVHGKYQKPCPVCGAPVQRIAYAANEANYCAVCQTGGKLLADRALSRLLKDDWPRTLDALEALKAAHQAGGKTGPDESP